ncbi:hypothetical protein EIP91_000257 [Steccherinum ochraceum]|uniref:Uncharacterized protein n=1 Tax=Steccherinum ochraceum TaxID=92696 RepID=A0A4R0RIP5_9APHY|nr:hypothetical protein EIP91_000257 [Steccherinum ochraceum]
MTDEQEASGHDMKISALEEPVADGVLPGMLCMVIPWMKNGSLRAYVGKMDDVGFKRVRELEVANITWLLRVWLNCTRILSEGTSYNYGSHHGCGVARRTAPEIFNPEVLGMKSTRTTFHNDINSFARTFVKLYTGQLSYLHLSDFQVPMQVVQYERPTRPVRFLLDLKQLPGL